MNTPRDPSCIIEQHLLNLFDELDQANEVREFIGLLLQGETDRTRYPRLVHNMLVSICWDCLSAYEGDFNAEDYDGDFSELGKSVFKKIESSTEVSVEVSVRALNELLEKSILEIINEKLEQEVKQKRAVLQKVKQEVKQKKKRAELQKKKRRAAK